MKRKEKKRRKNKYPSPFYGIYEKSPPGSNQPARRIFPATPRIFPLSLIEVISMRIVTHLMHNILLFVFHIVWQIDVLLRRKFGKCCGFLVAVGFY